MYTGIIECTGTLSALNKRGNGFFVKITTPKNFHVTNRVRIGDSVAANGVCLTATTVDEDGFTADVSAETVKLTCFKYYKVGQKLNLELPCTPTTHLGGHIVQGHVDGIGQIVNMEKLDEAINIWIKPSPDLLPYIALKGSITIDGASLTVNGLKDAMFRLTIIPHTMQTLAFSNWVAGSMVNIEVDVIARYLERLIDCKKAEQQKKNSTITYQMLVENGF